MISQDVPTAIYRRDVSTTFVVYIYPLIFPADEGLFTFRPSLLPEDALLPAVVNLVQDPVLTPNLDHRLLIEFTGN